MGRSVIITGMHRSGTSLLASVALAAGIDMGSELMPGGRGNRRGHFEDLDFYRFHERFLERREVSAFVVPDGWSPDPSPEEDGEARALASSDRPLWGFKDPKATLFLDFWDCLLPAPLYLFVYRHPVEVVLSLLRRGLELEIQQDPRVAFRAWMAYNERLLAFRAAHPGRCLLWHVAGATRSLDDTVGILEERLGRPLQRVDGNALFHPDELSGLVAREIDWPTLLPDVFELYRRLEEAADLPGTGLEPARPEPFRRERELVEANEHLLAALLGKASAVPSGTAGASSAFMRNDYTRLRLLAAQLEDDIRVHESEKAALSERLRLLAAHQVEETRAHEQEKAHLADRLRQMDEDRVRVESTGAWRAVQSYWSVARRARGWAQGVKSGVRRILQKDGRPSADQGVS